MSIATNGCQDNSNRPDQQEDDGKDVDCSPEASTNKEKFEESDPCNQQINLNLDAMPDPSARQTKVSFEYMSVPEQTLSQEDSDAEFAAALSAKLHNLDSVRGSPEPIGEYENPSSMETQGDALCGNSGPPSIDSVDPIDVDLPQSPNSYPIPDCTSFPFVQVLPQYGPMPDPASSQLETLSVDDTMTGGLFDDGDATNSLESGDIASETARAGVCGLRNLGNTCFMNSGLQCVMATPSILDFFLHFSPDESFQNKEIKNNTGFNLSKTFAALTKQIYSGQYSVIQPAKFKETFSESHSQFKGYRQHDCQEFLALLLDTLHEQLVHIQPVHKGPLSECTSMELHTPHSTEVSCDGKDNVFSFGESGKVLDKDVDSVSDFDRTCPGQDLENPANLETNINGDGMESRGSVSPKSYTSHSSLEDKFPSNIRMAPIPECIKTTWNGGSRASLASLDSHTTESDLDMVEDEGVGVVTSNLVPADQLKKKQVVFSDTNVTHGQAVGEDARNNAVSPMNVAIEDFLKEHKTLNVNMNITECGGSSMNNKINFDSEKFARHGYLDNIRPPTTIENLYSREQSTIEKNINVKRIKCCNLDAQGIQEEVEKEDTGGKFGKRIRLDSREKNILMETERRESEQEVMEGQTEPPSCCADTARDPARLKEAIEADRYWEKHLAANSTVMAHTFQGQFKNTVKCSECSHVSVSFEPFMYLTVPLPNAAHTQIEVTVILLGKGPSLHLLTLSRHQTLQEVRNLLNQRIPGLEEVKLAFAEVTRGKISRQLDETTWLKFINTTNRKLYAIQVINITPEETEASSAHADSVSRGSTQSPPSTSLKNDCLSEGIDGECADECAKQEETGAAGPSHAPKEEEGAPSSSGHGASMVSSLSSSRSDLGSSQNVSSSTSTGTLTDTPTITEDVKSVVYEKLKSCNICLEEMADSDLVTHIQCSCTLCRECVERSIKHLERETGKQQRCPVCLQDCDQSEWLQVDQADGVKPPLRLLTITTVLQTVLDGTTKTVGHPRVLSLPNCIKISRLESALIEEIDESFTLHLVDESTTRCSRCESGERCQGCPLSCLAKDGEVILKPGDRLALRLHSEDNNLLERVNSSKLHPSMQDERLKSELNMYDCLKAFSSREILDQNNPWFCPVCRKHQPATKTLSVWRYPDFLIIILKRFVYLERGPGGVAGSVKLDNRVEFPLEDLDLNPYLSGPLQEGGERFELYASISHFGSLSSGHYTAFARHPVSRMWHYFNDSQVEERAPVGENQDDAYVLFYRRSGLSYKLDIPSFGADAKLVPNSGAGGDQEQAGSNELLSVSPHPQQASSPGKRQSPTAAQATEAPLKD